MKILHTSDLHIGISLFGEDMLPYQESIGESLCAAADEYSADCIIIAGDVYDSAVVSGEAVKCWDRLCERLFSGGRDIPVIIIAGNHDSAPRLSVNSGLLENCGLYIRGSFRDYMKPISVGDADIYCIPWFNIAEVRELFSDREIKTCTDAFLAMTDDIKSSWDKSKKHIIVAHCFVTGAAISDSERASKGAEISAGGAQMVSADVFAGFDYIALGHLHRAQTIKCSADENTAVRYSGTPIPYSFSEAGQAKTYTVFDTEVGISELCAPSSLSLITVKGSYDEVMAAEVPEDAYVRVILTDRSSSAGLYENIRDRFPRMLRLECARKVSASADDSDSRISEMSVSEAELAEKYLRDCFGWEITERQLGWLEEAMKEEE
ncbi:putative uncharacterized protein [Ruminococcus sp. CAG:353]|nr:putative uncharacterized protein [Ruminococcus sp. CAG:353]